MALSSVRWDARTCISCLFPPESLGPYLRVSKGSEESTRRSPYEVVLLHMVFNQHQCMGVVVRVSHARFVGYIFLSWQVNVHQSPSDLPFTEKMDYFSAALAILYALYYTVVRLFHIYPTHLQDRLYLVSPPRAVTSNNTAHKLWSATCALVYLAHISYLILLPRFDYTYNIVFNVVLGLTHNALWLIYSLPASISLLQRFPSKPKSYRPSFASQPAILVAFTMAATTFELFDFPPWGRIIDAHSLWHLSTAPLVMLLYNFLINDALDEGWRGHKA